MRWKSNAQRYLVRDSIDWTKKSDEYVSAAFDFADAEMDKEDEDEEEDMKNPLTHSVVN